MPQRSTLLTFSVLHASGGFGESSDKERRVLPSAPAYLQVCSDRRVVQIHVCENMLCYMYLCVCVSVDGLRGGH